VIPSLAKRYILAAVEGVAQEITVTYIDKALIAIGIFNSD